MKKITLFSDGSALGNPGPGGHGVILRFGENEKEPCDVNVVSDSSYVVKGINECLTNWVRGHDGHIENERCDKLTYDEAQKMKASLN